MVESSPYWLAKDLDSRIEKGINAQRVILTLNAGAVWESEGIADLPLDGDRGTRSFDHRPAPAH